MSGFHVIRSDRPDGYGGSAILISNCIQYSPLNIDPRFNEYNIQTCGVRVKIQGSFIDIISVYTRPQHRLQAGYWDLLVQSINSNRFLLCGDFNAHHPSYGSTKENYEGREVVDFLSLSNSCILNDGTATLITSPNSLNKSVLDLSICSPSIAPLLDWAVVDEPLGSDHLPIILTLTSPGTNYQPFRHRNYWNIGKANWPCYTSSVDEHLKRGHNTPDTSHSYSTIKQAINLAASASIPRYKEYRGNRNRPAKPWWDSECNEAKQLSIVAYANYKNNSTCENYIKFKQASAKCRLLYKTKKKMKWQQFCYEFNSTTPSKIIWNKIKSLKTGLSTRNPKPSNNDWLNLYLHHLTPDHVQDRNIFQDVQLTNDHPLDRPFQMFELERALKNNINTAPGMDNIHYPMLSNLSASGKTALLRVLNNIWINGETIKDWSEILIIPILKPGKPPDDYKSYRPIALASCVGKTFERMMKARLEWWAESQGLIPEHQNGFRKARSTMDSLASFISDIHISNTNNKYLVAVSVDLEDAYNKVNINILMKKLINMGCPRRLAYNIYGLLRDRSITVWYNGLKHGPRITNSGLPQGAVLSPILFNIYTSDLKEALPHPYTGIQQFADDILLYNSSENLQNCLTKTENIMKSFSSWCETNGFTLQQNKSKAIVFTRHRISNLPSYLSFQNLSIEVVQSIKLLGLHIDNKLLWTTHINYLVGKCEESLNIIRCINHHSYGAEVQTALLLYRQLIRCRLDYGSFLYGDAADTNLKKLDKIQYKALRICMGAMNSTPTNALLVEAKDPPLYLRRQELAGRFLLNRITFKNFRLTSILSDLASEVLTHSYWSRKKMPLLISTYFTLTRYTASIQDQDNLPYFQFPLEYSIRNNPQILTTFFSYDSVLPSSFNNAEFSFKIKNRFPNSYWVFTDGSKLEDRVGCAVYDPQSDTSSKIRLHSSASIYTAEIIAIYEALKHISTLNNHNPTYIIFSDSLAALSKLKAPGNNPPLIILETIELLLQLLNEHTIYIVWIKGHAGIDGNEKVDQLAKQATKSDNIQVNKFLPSDIRSIIKKHTYSQWARTYTESSYHKGNFYHRIQPTIPYKPWFQGYNLGRKFATTMIRLRFNHNFSPHHLHRIGVHDDGKCECGQSGADSDHLILQCSKYSPSRNIIWSIMNKLKIPAQADLNSLLGKVNKELYTSIFDFISQNKIKL